MLEKLPESLGRILRGQRSGMDGIIFRHLVDHHEVPHIGVRSSAFENMGLIPVQFTADGDGISPPLEWRAVPEVAPVAIIVEDADSPTPHPFVHAILVMGPGNGSIAWGEMDEWLPPAPPSGDGVHRYAFQVFALGEGAQLPPKLNRQELMEVVLDRAIAAGCLVGTYERLRRQKIQDADEEPEPALTDVVADAVAAT